MIAAIALCAPALKNSSRRQDTYRSRRKESGAPPQPLNRLALALVRQYQARDEQADPEDGEGGDVGRALAHGEQARQAGREQQPGERGHQQCGSTDHTPPAPAPAEPWCQAMYTPATATTKTAKIGTTFTILASSERALAAPSGPW